MRAEGAACLAVKADVSNDADVARVVDGCMREFGRIDILHNNVGILRKGGAVDLDQATWDEVISTNLRSLFLTCHRVIPVMEQQGRGSIVNIGSIAGLRYTGVPLLAYSTSKGAILAFTRSMAAQYGERGIRANLVVPGTIDTPVARASSGVPRGAEGSDTEFAAIAPWIPLGRRGTAWDVAHASLFLASDEAAYVTGAMLLVDGGLSTAMPKPS